MRKTYRITSLFLAVVCLFAFSLFQPVYGLTDSLIVGGAVSAGSKTLEKFIKKMGRRAAANYITHTLRTKLLKAGLKAMIANKIVKSIGAIFAVISAFFDIGGFIFDWIDAHDKRPNSGYIDW